MGWFDMFKRGEISAEELVEKSQSQREKGQRQWENFRDAKKFGVIPKDSAYSDYYPDESEEWESEE